MAAMWPVGGQAATAGKLTNKAGQAVVENLDKADEALAGLSKMSDEFTDMILNQPCFPAGTPILTPLGHTLIEDLRVGDAVLSRPEYDAHASTNWQKVEAVYTRESEVMELHVCGRVIKTTEEHPFWVKDYGWVAAGELEAGDQFSTHDGNWITLDEIRYTGEWTTVYNFRVQEDHTYFVGQAEWGFTVWVHNTHADELLALANSQTINKIGDLTSAQRTKLQAIWDGSPVSSLPLKTREQLAEMYSQVASKNVPGTAQAAFNQARANYLLGKGPNPGRSVNAFANLYNLVKFKR